jgi:hypothetical protein
MAKNIRPKNNQHAFDLALQGIRKQNYARSTKGSSCLYRGPNNCRCALGHMIPNSLYSKSMEGMIPQGSLFCNFPKLQEYLSKVNSKLLAELQNAHDVVLARGNAEFENRMQVIADKWNLKYAKPN